jgi:hypothetical protein
LSRLEVERSLLGAQVDSESPPPSGQLIRSRAYIAVQDAEHLAFGEPIGWREPRRFDVADASPPRPASDSASDGPLFPKEPPSPGSRFAIRGRPAVLRACTCDHLKETRLMIEFNTHNPVLAEDLGAATARSPA